MFTIEHDEDETAITILDESAQYDDVQVLLYDDTVYIRQYHEELGRYHVICFTAEMYVEMMEAWQLPEGAYILDKRSKRKVESQKS